MILLLIASLAVAASPLTMTDYVSMPAISAVHFSPEGSRIAYVITRPNFAHASYDGEIHVINTDGTGDVTLTRSDASDDHPRWSPDGKRIAFLSDRGGRTAVFTIDVDGGEASALTDEPTAIRDFDWSPDGRMIVFTRGDDATADEKRRTKEKDDAHVIGENPRYSRLYAIDVDSRRVRRLTDGAYSVWAFSISPDSRTIVFDRSPGVGLDDLYRTDLSIMPMNGGEPRPLVKRAGIDRSPLFSPDGKSIAFMSGGGVHDWLRENALYVVSVERGAGSQSALGRLESRPYVVSARYDRTPESFFWSADSRSIYFDGPWNTTSQLFRVNAGGDGFANVSNVAGVLSESDVDTKHDQAAFVFQTLTEPPELYVSSLRKFAPRRLTNINAAYRDRTIGETRLVRWKNPKDGLEIEGLLTLPLGYVPGKRVPLLTFVHGGPASHFDQAFLGYLAYIYPVQIFAADGYAVLRPNPRGTGGYGEKFRAANRDDWGGMDWIDINAGIDKVIADGIADPGRLGLMGWSYGGFMTAWAAGHSDRFKAISIGAPVVDLLSFHGTSDIRDFIPNYFPPPASTEAPILEEMKHAPLSLDLLREHSPLWHLRPTKTPILIQQGEADERVPLSQGTMLYRMLDELGANVTMVTYPRSQHTPREPKLRLDVGRRNIEFMEKWVK
ncbi:MAG TPA: S9 family peptidase [Thermoanaerobaculia bacterium]